MIVLAAQFVLGVVINGVWSQSVTVEYATSCASDDQKLLEGSPWRLTCNYEGLTSKAVNIVRWLTGDAEVYSNNQITYVPGEPHNGIAGGAQQGNVASVDAHDDRISIKLNSFSVSDVTGWLCEVDAGSIATAALDLRSAEICDDDGVSVDVAYTTSCSHAGKLQLGSPWTLKCNYVHFNSSRVLSVTWLTSTDNSTENQIVYIPGDGVVGGAQMDHVQAVAGEDSFVSITLAKFASSDITTWICQVDDGVSLPTDSLELYLAEPCEVRPTLFFGQNITDCGDANLTCVFGKTVATIQSDGGEILFEKEDSTMYTYTPSDDILDSQGDVVSSATATEMGARLTLVVASFDETNGGDWTCAINGSRIEGDNVVSDPATFSVTGADCIVLGPSGNFSVSRNVESGAQRTGATDFVSVSMISSLIQTLLIHQ